MPDQDFIPYTPDFIPVPSPPRKTWNNQSVEMVLPGKAPIRTIGDLSNYKGTDFISYSPPGNPNIGIPGRTFGYDPGDTSGPSPPQPQPPGFFDPLAPKLPPGAENIIRAVAPNVAYAMENDPNSARRGVGKALLGMGDVNSLLMGIPAAFAGPAGLAGLTAMGLRGLAGQMGNAPKDFQEDPVAALTGMGTNAAMIAAPFALKGLHGGGPREALTGPESVRSDVAPGGGDIAGLLAGRRGQEGAPPTQVRGVQSAPPEVVAEPTSATGARNAVTEAERVMRGLEPEVSGKAWTPVKEAFEQGRDMVDNQGLDPRGLAAAIATNPKRTPNAAEIGALTYDRARIIAEDRTLESQPVTEETAARRADLADVFRINDEALQRGGTEQSAAFNARKMLIGEDYSYLGSRMRAERAKGSPLTPQENSAIQDAATNVEQSQAARDALSDKAVQDVISKVKQDVNPTGKVPNQTRIAELKTEMADLLDRMRKISTTDNQGNVRLGSGLTDEHVLLFGKIVRNLVEQGVERASEIVKFIHDNISDVVDVSLRDVRDAISGYGREVEPRTLIQQKIQKLKTLLNRISAMEDVSEGKPKWQKPTKEVDPQIQSLNKEIRAMEEQMGLGGKTPKPKDIIGRTPTNAERLAQAKLRVQNAIDETNLKIKVYEQTGHVLKKEPIPLEKDAELEAAELKLQDAHARLKQAVAAPSGGTHWSEWPAKALRFAILSGMAGLGKITVAGPLLRPIANPAEEAIGGVLSKVPGISKVAANAPVEGGFSPKAEVAAFRAAWSLETLADINRKVPLAEMLKAKVEGRPTTATGAHSLDLEYQRVTGKEAPGVHQPEFADLPGLIHAGIKTMPQREAYYRALTKASAWEVRQGNSVAPSTPGEARAVMAAYDAGLRAILQQDNWVVRMWNSGLYQAISTTKPNTIERGGARLLNFAARTTVPIIKVPTNFVAETGLYLGGGVNAAIRAGLAKVRGEMTPIEADYIMRALKKQGLGAAMFATGYFGYKSVQGFYQREKPPQKGHEENEINLFGVTIPPNLTHSAALNAMQAGATFRRAQEAGKVNPVYATGRGLIEELPFYREIEMLSTLKEGENAFGKAAGSYLSGWNPRLVQEIAQKQDSMDKRARQPRGFREMLKMGVPGQRETVPTKAQVKAGYR